MKKHFQILIIVVMCFLVVFGTALAANNNKKSNRVYVLSDNPILKAMLGVNHEFPGAFSTQASSRAKALEKLGFIKTEPVRIYSISAPPGSCGNGTLDPGEKCEDGVLDCAEGYICNNCKCEPIASPDPEPDPSIRSCYASTTMPWGITRVNGGLGGDGVKVAVLDTGVNKEHLDLKNRIIECKDFTKGPKIRNGCKDGHGHGTHVAGIALADGGDDGKGIFGVAPGADLMAYRVCNDFGICYGDDVAIAIRHAADQGANIISMSLGGDYPDLLKEQAIQYAYNIKNVLVVAAAGNDRYINNEIVYGSIDYPAVYAEVVAVAAFDSGDNMAYFSSLGINDITTEWVVEERDIEFAAPGVFVYSTYNNGCYATMSGTSMAAPHIAGLAALNWTGNAVETRESMQNKARYYSIDYGIPGDDIEAGFGLPIN